MRISVVTPLYASGPYIDELYSRFVDTILSIADEYEIIFVNDASPDDSLARAKSIADDDPHVTVIDLSRNFGQHRALVTGLAAASGDYIFICDSDLEEEPEWIAKFLSEIQRTACDVVYGVQINKKGGARYHIFRSLFYGTLNYLAAARFPENVTTARLMSQRYVRAFLDYKEREIYLTGIFHMVGFTQLPCEVFKNDTSPTTYRLPHLVSLFVNAITAFSIKPLIFIGLSGIVLSIFAMLFVAHVVFRKLVYGIDVEGWASVMAATLSIGGLTIFFNGIVAIYIAKIFLEVKQRPVTTIREVYRNPNASQQIESCARTVPGLPLLKTQIEQQPNHQNI